MLVTSALVISWVMQKHRRRLKASRFATRPTIAVDQLIAESYSSEPEYHDVLAHWWKKSAAILGIDARLLRSKDRFDRELAPVAGFPVEDEIVQLDELIDDLALGEQLSQTALKLETFGEYVWFLAHTANKERWPR